MVAGFTCVWIEHDEKEFMTTLTDFAYISDLFVFPKYRGDGLGTALLEKVKEYVREQGVKVLKVETLFKNQNAIDVYKKANFEYYEMVVLAYLN